MNDELTDLWGSRLLVPQGLGSSGGTRGTGGRRRIRRGMGKLVYIYMDVRNGGTYIYIWM